MRAETLKKHFFFCQSDEYKVLYNCICIFLSSREVEFFLILEFNNYFEYIYCAFLIVFLFKLNYFEKVNIGKKHSCNNSLELTKVTVLPQYLQK